MASISGAHLVGSAPVSTPEQLWSLAARHLPGRLRRLPDGEIGERDTWIAWQYDKLGQSPQLEAALDDDAYRTLKQYAMRQGVADDAEVELPDLGYAEAAIASWGRFEKARREGEIPSDVRFTVGLPSALSVVTLYVSPESRPGVYTAYRAAMDAELDRILGAIPHGDLAIQWEVCIEFGILEGLWTCLDTPSSGDDAKPTIAELLAHMGAAVPSEVELGFHLCYGDSGHKHFTEPTDAGYLAWAMQTIFERITRRVDWIHLPVPKGRDDVEYFEPLGAVDLPAETELYLGLVHTTGGLEGTRRRIEAASKVVPSFGVATECGLGRRPIETIGPLLDQHAECSQPLTG